MAVKMITKVINNLAVFCQGWLAYSDAFFSEFETLNAFKLF
jgi:hypothetical protein